MRHPKNPLSGGGKGQLSPELFKTEVNERFANYLRWLRTQVGISQQDLSLHLRRGPKYIWRLENRYSEADLFEFVEIMDALGLDPIKAFEDFLKPANGAQGKDAEWTRVPLL